MSKKYELDRIRSVYEKVINEDMHYMDLSSSLFDNEPGPVPQIQPVIHSAHENPEPEKRNSDMAKSELFSILKDGTDLLDMLNHTEDMDPWMLSKIVKASDYIISVKKALEYDKFEKECMNSSDVEDMNDGLRLASNIKGMLDGEGMGVNEAVLKNVIFNIECLKANRL